MGDSKPRVEVPERILRCTVCNTAVNVCSVCRTGFLAEHVIRCRRESGHDHASCATAKMRTVPERASTNPPASAATNPPASAARTKPPKK